MASVHRATFELLGTDPRTSTAAVGELERTEQRLGMRLPLSVREWYSYNGALPILAADSNDDLPIPVQEFSTYIYTCVWDYHVVLRQPALVQAQNGPLSPQALQALQGLFDERPRTAGWPGSAQYRFDGRQHGILIWSMEAQQADWFVGAADANSLESALRLVWHLDGVGESFYDCSKIAKVILAKLKSDA
jgi:hypothetical protein